jgi:hypothetical protein
MLHAQSKMAEVIAGAVPTDGQSEQPIEEDSEFRWSMESEQGPADGVLSVTIKVSRSRGIGSPLSVSLRQLVLDPSRVGSTQDVPPSSASSTSSSSSGSSTTGSGSSTTSSGPTSTSTTGK